MKPINKSCKRCKEKIKPEDKSAALLTFEGSHLKEGVYLLVSVLS